MVISKVMLNATNTATAPRIAPVKLGTRNRPGSMSGSRRRALHPDEHPDQHRQHPEAGEHDRRGPAESGRFDQQRHGKPQHDDEKELSR